jgi:hypothetical protein
VVKIGGEGDNEDKWWQAGGIRQDETGKKRKKREGEKGCFFHKKYSFLRKETLFLKKKILFFKRKTEFLRKKLLFL